MWVSARTIIISRRVWLVIPLASTLVVADHERALRTIHALPTLLSVARAMTAHGRLDLLQIVGSFDPCAPPGIYSVEALGRQQVALHMMPKETSRGAERLRADKSFNLQISATLGVRG